MSLPDISESEWIVMEALWECPAQTASALTRRLLLKTNWAENTVRTLLSRLVDKRVLKTGQNASGTRTFIPILKREAYVGAESESFMHRIFGGMARPLLIHFAQSAKLTTEEVRELKRLLDQTLRKKH